MKTIKVTPRYEDGNTWLVEHREGADFVEIPVPLWQAYLAHEAQCRFWNSLCRDLDNLAWCQRNPDDPMAEAYVPEWAKEVKT